MRRTPWLIGIVLGVITVPVLAGYNGIQAKVRIDAKAMCEPKWPNDFSMQATCVDVMVDGWKVFQGISQEFAGNRAMEKALLKCLDDWTTDGRTDFSMAGTCARLQKEGWERLNR